MSRANGAAFLASYDAVGRPAVPDPDDPGEADFWDTAYIQAALGVQLCKPGLDAAAVARLAADQADALLAERRERQWAAAGGRYTTAAE